MSISIEIPELAKLAQSMAGHESTFNAEIKRAENDGLTLLRDEVRRRATSIASDGRLVNSVRFETISGGLSGIVGSVANTALSIEQGRKAGSTPNVGLLEGWVSRKGLAGTPRSVKTHRVTGRSGAVRSAERDLAWKIALAIRARGTKPLPFIGPAASAKATQITAIFSDAVNRALRKVANA